MLIVFLHQTFPCSGAEQVTIDVANYLCRQGHQVTILAVNHQTNAYPAGATRLFQIYQLPKGRVKYSRRVAHAVRRFVLQEHPQVLVTYRELLYASWLKRQTGLKLVFELHNTPCYEFLDLTDKRHESRWKNLFYGCGVAWLLRQFYLSKYRRVYRWCDVYGVLCDAYRLELAGLLHLDAINNKLWVLPNSIAPARHVNETKEKVALYVGRLTHRDKRVDRLLRIWQKASRQMPGWQLKIVGDGKAASKLKVLAEVLELERCSFEGYSTRVADYYDEASVLCLTSSFEGWPMSVAEAQAHGVVPVVFNSFAGAADMISTEMEGCLVAPFNEDAFARTLVLLASDATRLQAMQRAVVKKAKQYSIERAGEAWLQMLNHIVQDS